MLFFKSSISCGLFVDVIADLASIKSTSQVFCAYDVTLHTLLLKSLPACVVGPTVGAFFTLTVA